jgi:hypothetical protein
MRVKDDKRLIAMTEIEVRAKSILFMVEQYRFFYKDETIGGQQKLDVLDDVWRLITENQIRLTEILRENGI